MVASPVNGSAYWNATWPEAKRRLAISSPTTNFPSPWLTATVWSCPGVKPLSQGDETDATLVVTIWDTCRLMSLRKRVGESTVTFPALPNGSRPLFTSAWKPLQIPSTRPPRESSDSTAAATEALHSTEAMNLPLPSGSSPRENPPDSISMCERDRLLQNRPMESITSCPVRFRKTSDITVAPASRKALAES